MREMPIWTAGSQPRAASAVPFATIDLGLWYRGDGATKQIVAERMNKLCRTDGIFYLANHRVPAYLTDDVLAMARQFFALPADSKAAIHFDKFGRRHGYIPLRGEASDPGSEADEKETLSFTLPIPRSSPTFPPAEVLRAKNSWPEQLPGLPELIHAYFREMLRLSGEIFAVIATGFGLPESYFRDKTDRPIAQLRLLHYPPAGAAGGRAATGAGAHADLGCFTILVQDSNSGLQVHDTAGNWIDAPPLPGTLVVNVGEMLARWTNDLFHAPRHRVINRSRRKRYSIPFFVAANDDAVISCLDGCCAPDDAARYPPLSAGRILAARIAERFGR